MFQSYLFLCGGAMCVLLLSGCATTPFVPVVVPEKTSLRPEISTKKIATRAELLAFQNVKPPAYVIAPQDAFALVVDGDPGLSRPKVNVMPDGSISVAPIGKVIIAGKTLDAASEVLTQKYRKFVKECSVILEPVAIKPYTFTIAGSVTAPGIYPFVFGSFRLSDAVALAKGVSASKENNEKYVLGDLANAYISRKGEILPIDFVKVLEEGDALNNIPVLDGDYIYIPSLEGGKITVLGEVDSPGCFPYQPNLTLLQSIGFAGGLVETNSNIIKVIRGGMKNPVVFTVNVKDMQLGRVKDFALAPKDVIFVPRDGISDWNLITRQIMPSIQLLNGLAGPFGSPSSFIYK